MFDTHCYSSSASKCLSVSTDEKIAKDYLPQNVELANWVYCNSFFLKNLSSQFIFLYYIVTESATNITLAWMMNISRFSAKSTVFHQRKGRELRFLSPYQVPGAGITVFHVISHFILSIKSWRLGNKASERTCILPKGVELRKWGFGI